MCGKLIEINGGGLKDGEGDVAELRAVESLWDCHF